MQYLQAVFTYLYLAGLGEKPVVFEVADSSLPHEEAFDDINALLNTASVPGLFVVGGGGCLSCRIGSDGG